MQLRSAFPKTASGKKSLVCPIASSANRPARRAASRVWCRRRKSCVGVICYADHLGTPRAITRPSDNQVVWKWENSDPFGANLPNQNPSGLGDFVYNNRFPGQQYDQETGTHYNGARDYDPFTGRYIQSDGIGLDGGLSTYAYGASDPLSKTDPSGYFVFFVIPNDRDIIFPLIIAPKKVPGMWACTAKCPMLPAVQSCPPPNCAGTVLGYGVGVNLTQAKNRAKDNAQPNPGCQLKHCTYACRSPKGDPVYPGRD